MPEYKPYDSFSEYQVPLTPAYIAQQKLIVAQSRKKAKEEEDEKKVNYLVWKFNTNLDTGSFHFTEREFESYIIDRAIERMTKSGWDCEFKYSPGGGNNCSVTFKSK